jgi:acyl-CoA reductase-like NAD-dependent aldehyde dehydrogenase
MSRLPITKTPKCFVGGAFIRSESGRVYAHNDSIGEFVCNIPLCTRKDLRNAVEAAAKAGPGWAGRSAYNRGQILYRLAEMLEARSEEMTSALAITRPNRDAASREVRASIDRITHYAGWTDKYESLLGSVNPVSTPHFNFTVMEPMGIIGLLAPEESPLLGLLSMILPAITSGNTVIALASHSQPYPSILLGEMLATSDLPGGVVNLLTGTRADTLPTFATHAHLRAVYAVANKDERTEIQRGAAEHVKRTVFLNAEKPIDWFEEKSQGLYHIRHFLEAKTTWHPVGA